MQLWLNDLTHVTVLESELTNYSERNKEVFYGPEAARLINLRRIQLGDACGIIA